MSGTQVQTTAACSPWQKGRVEQRIATIKEVAGTTILQHQVVERSALSVVSYEVAHALNQRAGRFGILSATLMEHGEVVSIRRWWTKETSWQDVSSFGRQRERPWKNMLLRKRSEEQLPHVPGKRKHSSPVPSVSFTEEVPENYEDLALQPGPPPPVEVPTDHQANLKSRHARI